MCAYVFINNEVYFSVYVCIYNISIKYLSFTNVLVYDIFLYFSQYIHTHTYITKLYMAFLNVIKFLKRRRLVTSFTLNSTPTESMSVSPSVHPSVRSFVCLSVSAVFRVCCACSCLHACCRTYVCMHEYVLPLNGQCH